jgi:hypothetical protein
LSLSSYPLFQTLGEKTAKKANISKRPININAIKIDLDATFNPPYEKPSANVPIIGPILLIEAADKASEETKSLPAIVRAMIPIMNIAKNKKKNPNIGFTSSSLNPLPLYLTRIIARG